MEYSRINQYLWENPRNAEMVLKCIKRSIKVVYKPFKFLINHSSLQHRAVAPTVGYGFVDFGSGIIQSYGHICIVQLHIWSGAYCVHACIVCASCWGAKNWHACSSYSAQLRFPFGTFPRKGCWTLDIKVWKYVPLELLQSSPQFQLWQ